MSGRVNPALTDSMLSLIEDWTGDKPVCGCPWRALYDPFVQRVLGAYEHAELGTAALAYSRLSQRMAKGLEHYRRVLGAVKGKRWEWDEAERKRKDNR